MVRFHPCGRMGLSRKSRKFFGDRKTILALKRPLKNRILRQHLEDAMVEAERHMEATKGKQDTGRF